MRSSSEVHNFLLEEEVPHEILHLPSLADTARRAAESLGVPLGEVVKTLLFLLDGAPTLILVPGDAVASPALIANAAGCAEVILASPHDVLRITGYRPGALPPCALAEPLPALADPQVFSPAVVYCGGGTLTTMLKLRSADLRHVVQPRIVPIGHWPQWAEAETEVADTARQRGRGRPTG